MAFGFYSDSALTTPVTSLVFMQASADPVAADRVIYLGNPSAGTLQAASDPGVDQIVVSVVDSTPSGGQPSSAIRLALSSGGLDSATPGASLNVGATISGLSANAVAIHIRALDSTGVVGVYNDLSLATNEVLG